jgi:hypothetical protein
MYWNKVDKGGAPFLLVSRRKCVPDSSQSR